VSNDSSPFDEHTQGYIMTGHGRTVVWHALIRFRDYADPAKIRQALQDIATGKYIAKGKDIEDEGVTSTAKLRGLKEETRDLEIAKPPVEKDTNLVVLAMGLTWSGYRALGYDPAGKFTLEFEDGFAMRAKDVTGRDNRDWDPIWKGRAYDAILILAAGKENSRDLKDQFRKRLKNFKQRVSDIKAETENLLDQPQAKLTKRAENLLDQPQAKLAEEEVLNDSEINKVRKKLINQEEATVLVQAGKHPDQEIANIRSKINEMAEKVLEEGQTKIEDDVESPLAKLQATAKQEAEQLLGPRKNQIEDLIRELARIDWLEAEIKRGILGPIEHFGFRDGIGQPERELQGSIGLDRKGVALIKEPFWLKADEYGSYLAFLQIEQHPERFRDASRELARRLYDTPAPGPGHCKYAEELIFGRRKDGTPMSGYDPAKKTTSPKEFFSLAAALSNKKLNDLGVNPSGGQWAFASHTRKMNFREPGQEHHRIVRRSTMYKDKASGRVGIYFQSFQANLEGQFEFLLKRWANVRSHPKTGCGVDPLVGVDPTGHPQQWPRPHEQNAPGPAHVSISGLTTIRGGEYFYFPSIPFLHKIADGVSKEFEEAKKQEAEEESARVSKV
jgi:Dyp-type peroxidase family